MQLRQRVFVVEQRCCYQDADGLDHAARHLLGTTAGQLVAYLRVLQSGQRYPEPAISRVVVDAAFRRRGLGRALMIEGIRWAEEQYPQSGIRLAAQTYLEGFYRSFGFATVGAEYLHDGIPHLEMFRQRRGAV